VTVPGGADPQTAALTVQSTYTTGARRGVTGMHIFALAMG